MAAKGSHEAALDASLKGMAVQPTDAAAVALAREYAVTLDNDPASLVKIGAQFLAVLDALGITPKARAAKGDKQTPGISPLDELRAARERKAKAR